MAIESNHAQNLTKIRSIAINNFGSESTAELAQSTSCLVREQSYRCILLWSCLGSLKLVIHGWG